ncbi:hypothetical protein LJC63_02740 [Ruminococcaceae bacterium OttesenSCG-928-L11]|nr:hypothetical protein [Ruminococcaceae bacterium OttesenSCG-928-L11]
MTKPDCVDKDSALRAIADMMARAEQAQVKFAIGTSQHTLQENRIHALRVAQALVSGESGVFVDADLERARAPLASLISKSEKAQSKLREESWQHQMLGRNLEALRLARVLLETNRMDNQGGTR